MLDDSTVGFDDAGSAVDFGLLGLDCATRAAATFVCEAAAEHTHATAGSAISNAMLCAKTQLLSLNRVAGL